VKTWYIYIENLRLIGKIENNIPYIYKKEEGWIPHIAPMDCAMGNNMNFEEITEDDVNKKIAEVEG